MPEDRPPPPWLMPQNRLRLIAEKSRHHRRRLVRRPPLCRRRVVRLTPLFCATPNRTLRPLYFADCRPGHVVVVFWLAVIATSDTKTRPRRSSKTPDRRDLYFGHVAYA